VVVEDSGVSVGGYYRVYWTVYRRRKIASTRWRSDAVMKPLRAEQAYSSFATTTDRKTVCRPASVRLWWCSIRNAYNWPPKLIFLDELSWDRSYRIFDMKNQCTNLYYQQRARCLWPIFLRIAKIKVHIA